MHLLRIPIVKNKTVKVKIIKDVIYEIVSSSRITKSRIYVNLDL